MNMTNEAVLANEAQGHLTEILGEELTRQLQSTMRQASDRQLIELRESLQIMFQWMQENGSERQTSAV